MNTVAAKLDHAGFNPRVVSLFIITEALIAWLVMPCFTPTLRWNGVIDVDLKRLGSFAFDPDKGQLRSIPEWIRELDGKRVALEGFMKGADGRIDRPWSFESIYDMPKEWQALKLQERIFVSASKQVPVGFSKDEVRAIGVLHVRIERDSDTHVIRRIFEMDLDRVEPL